ncbi:MAG: O-antigen ligase family protein, partial [Lutibacter sp.]
LICMFLAAGIIMVARLPVVSIKPLRIIFIFFGTMILYGIMESLFNLTDTIIVMLGRRPDLTTRVPMWDDLLGMVKNPIIGFGYESFWLGARRDYIIEEWGIASQAHNGYLEMYLNMGLIGVLFLMTWLISGLKKIMRYLAIDYPNGVLRFCLVVIIAIYNWAEATFFGTTNMWLLFFLAIMDPLNNTKPNTQTPSEHDIKTIS